MPKGKESKWRPPVVTPPETGQAFWEKAEVKGTGSGLGQGCALPSLPLPPPLAGYFPSVFNCSKLQFSLLLDGNCTTSCGECLRVTGPLPTPPGLTPGADTEQEQGINSYYLSYSGKNHPVQRRAKVTAGIQAGSLN